MTDGGDLGGSSLGSSLRLSTLHGLSLRLSLDVSLDLSCLSLKLRLLLLLHEEQFRQSIVSRHEGIRQAGDGGETRLGNDWRRDTHRWSGLRCN